MNSTEMAVAAPTDSRTWHEIVRDTLKRNDVRLAVYVPDNVLKPLINDLAADPFFSTFSATREGDPCGRPGCSVAVARGRPQGPPLRVGISEVNGRSREEE